MEDEAEKDRRYQFIRILEKKRLKMIEGISMINIVIQREIFVNFQLF